MISSVIGILLSMTCLVSTTWALFTVSITNENNEIQLGEVTVTVAINGVETAPDNGVYLLNAGTNEIKITNSGTINGYCRITLADQEILTATIPLGGSQILSINVADGSAAMTVTCCWGESPGNAALTEPIVATIGEETEETTVPTEESTAPDEETEATEESTAATEEDAESSEEATESTEESTAATEETTDPTEASTAPTEEATDPTEASTAPAPQPEQ